MTSAYAPRPGVGHASPAGSAFNWIASAQSGLNPTTYRNIHGSGPDQGQKRHLCDDSNSKTSRVSRWTSFTPNTMATTRWQTGTTGDMSVSEKNRYKPGSILLAYHFEEAYAPGSTMESDKSIIHIPGERVICKKVRLFIVVAAHALTYICLPMYTHNGKGTINKPNREEYVSVRDHRAKLKGPLQSTHEPLETTTMSGPVLLTTSAVHLAYPVARSYRIPVKVVGRLDSWSINHLIRLFRGYMPTELPEPPNPSTTLSSPNTPARTTHSHPNILIHAEVGLDVVLKNLNFDQYSHLFLGQSWSNAPQLKDKKLQEIGVVSPGHRQTLARLFEKVKIAMRSGDDWKLTVAENTLASSG